MDSKWASEADWARLAHHDLPYHEVVRYVYSSASLHAKTNSEVTLNHIMICITLQTANSNHFVLPIDAERHPGRIIPSANYDNDPPLV